MDFHIFWCFSWITRMKKMKEMKEMSKRGCDEAAVLIIMCCSLLSNLRIFDGNKFIFFKVKISSFKSTYRVHLNFKQKSMVLLGLTMMWREFFLSSWIFVMRKAKRRNKNNKKEDGFNSKELFEIRTWREKSTIKNSKMDLVNARWAIEIN